MRRDKSEAHVASDAGNQSNSGLLKVQFVGVPRLRTGVSQWYAQPGTLQNVLQQVCQQFPALGDLITESGQLASWYRIALDEGEFVEDLQLPVQAGQTLLILSADVGG